MRVFQRAQIEGRDIEDEDDEEAAHGRGAALVEDAGLQAAGGGGLIDIVLAELQFLEPADHAGAEPPAQRQGGEGRARAAEGDVGEEAQGGESGAQGGVPGQGVGDLAEVKKHVKRGNC